MNTDIDFMKIAEGDKEFVRDFENLVNGKVSSTENPVLRIDRSNQTHLAITAKGLE